MGDVTLNIRVKEQRLISLSDAAIYCSLKAKSFAVDCSVKPVAMPNGQKLYDKHDLDVWIDSLKEGQPNGDEDIIARLGK